MYIQSVNETYPLAPHCKLGICLELYKNILQNNKHITNLHDIICHKELTALIVAGNFLRLLQKSISHDSCHKFTYSTKQ